MNFIELQNEVSRRINESLTAPVYYTGVEIKDAINGAYRSFALFTLCLEKTGILSVIADQVFANASTTLTDWICPLRLETGGVKLDQSPIDEFASINPLWAQPASHGAILRYACLGHDLLAFQPIPSANASISCRYAYSPADMIASAEVPAIPAEDHLALVEYAVVRLRAKDGGKELAGEMARMKVFMDACAKRARIVRDRALQLRYDNAPSERWLKLMEDQWLTSPKS
jgi:hypothetical protein